MNGESSQLYFVKNQRISKSRSTCPFFKIRLDISFLQKYYYIQVPNSLRATGHMAILSHNNTTVYPCLNIQEDSLSELIRWSFMLLKFDLQCPGVCSYVGQWNRWQGGEHGKGNLIESLPVPFLLKFREGNWPVINFNI